MNSDYRLDDDVMRVPPTYLYKYRPLSGQTRGFTEDIFRRTALYWPAASTLNDPFDCNPGITDQGSKLKRESMQRRLIRKQMPYADARELRRLGRIAAGRSRREVEASMAILQRSSRAALAICSLTAVPDDILMWSHYADYHRGICLQFRTTNQLQVHFGLALPVTYSQHRPLIEMTDRGRGADLLKRVALTKAKHWEYEHEWRLLSQLETGHHPFPSVDLTAVILGAEISASDEADVRAWAAPYLDPAHILRANLHPLEFRLQIEGLQRGEPESRLNSGTP